MNEKMKKILLAIVVLLVIGSCIFMFKISPISKTEKVTEVRNREMPAANATTDELTKGLIVSEEFTNTTDNINEIAVVFTRNYMLDEKDASNTLAIELLDGNKVLASGSFITNDIPDQHRVYVYPTSPITGMVGKKLTLIVYDNSGCDTGVSLMIDNTSTSSFKFGNKKQDGTICFSITGE